MKKKLTIVGIILILVVGLAGGYYIIKGLKITPKNARLEILDTRVISQEDAALINSCRWNDIHGDGTYSEPGDYSYEMKRTSDDNYGHIFTITYNFNMKRMSNLNDYNIDVEVDTSRLSEKEQIFFHTMYPRPDDKVFYDDKKTNYWVSLSGCSFDYTKEELAEICSKIKLTLYIIDANGNNKERKYSFSTNDVSIDDVSKNEQKEDLRFYGFE